MRSHRISDPCLYNEHNSAFPRRISRAKLGLLSVLTFGEERFENPNAYSCNCCQRSQGPG